MENNDILKYIEDKKSFIYYLSHLYQILCLAGLSKTEIVHILHKAGENLERENNT